MDSLCSCEKKEISTMGKSEILKESEKSLDQDNYSKYKSRNRELKKSTQTLRKTEQIEQFLGPIENEEENFLNTAKNTLPSNNPLSNRSNEPNCSVLFDIPLGSFHIESNNNSDIIQNDKKNENLFGHMSKIEENKLDKKILYERASKNSLNNLMKGFNKDSKINNINNIYNNKNDKYKGNKIIYNYEGENCIYIGELNDKSIINGEGILNFKNGKIIQGNFLNGKLNGKGKYIDEDGTIYEGIFENGILNGNGKIIKINDNNKKIIYNGNIKNFKKEGMGREECSEYIYEGKFKNDLKNGKGQIKFINSGDYYEGEFSNDKITGFGYYKWANEEQYFGCFIEGEMNGKGKYKWPDGSEYEGDYIKNKREGKGKFKWSSGSIFEGLFLNGKPNKGILINKGSKYNAELKNGHLTITKEFNK